MRNRSLRPDYRLPHLHRNRLGGSRQCRTGVANATPDDRVPHVRRAFVGARGRRRGRAGDPMTTESKPNVIDRHGYHVTWCSDYGSTEFTGHEDDMPYCYKQIAGVPLITE